MRKIIALVALSVGLYGVSAEAREREVITPSGLPEMVFVSSNAERASSQIVDACMTTGWLISSQSENQVVCEIRMGVVRGAITQALIGNQYSTPPKTYVRFGLGRVGEHVRVQANAWVETQMPFGQVQQHQYTDDNSFNMMMGFLAQARAQLPIGTIYAPTTFLGVGHEATTWQDGRRTRNAVKILTVKKDSTSERMGILVDDILIKVNTRTIRTTQDLGAALQRQRVGEKITVEVMRNGERMVLEGTAQRRGPISAYVSEKDVPEGQLPSAIQIAAAQMGGIEAVRAALGIVHQAEEVADEHIIEEIVEASSELSELEAARKALKEAQERLSEAEQQETKSKT